MFGHVRLKSANMLSCGSQRAEASSPIQIAAARCHSLAAESPVHDKYVRHCAASRAWSQNGVSRKAEHSNVRHYNRNVPQCPSGLGS